MKLFKMGKDIQIKRFPFGNWKRTMLGEMVQKWGRARFYISTNYFLVKTSLLKLRTFTLKHAGILIMVQQKSNQKCKGRT